MGRGLMTLGAALLLLTLGLWIGDAIGAVTPRQAAWSDETLKAGAALVALGLLLKVAYSPVRHQLARGRCAVCGHPVERGHTYCLDHLQQTVNAYRDKTHERMLRGTKGRS